MSNLLIKNLDLIATVDQQSTELMNADILIEGPAIKSIGPGLTPPENTRVIDGRGKVALPGFVNTHHHMYQIYTRDLPRTNNVKNLFDWITLSYDIWHEIDTELVYLSSLVSLGTLLKTGCTLSSDMFYVFPDTADKKLIDAEIQAAKELGIRFHPTRGAMSLDKDHGGLVPTDVIQSDDDILQDYERLVNAYHDPTPFSMLRIALGPTSIFSVTSNLMRETIKYGRKHGLYSHTHLAEGLIEEEWCLKMYGLRPFELMESLEWVGPDVWFAHAIDLSDDEIRRLGEYKCGVATCASSNARFGYGIAPILKMDNAGAKISFGVDGAGGYGDMIAEIQVALELHRNITKNRKPLIREFLRFGTKSGAEVLGWDEVGSLEPGKAADICLVDMHQLDFAGCQYDKITSIFLFASNHTVDTTIVNGEIVAEKGHLLRLNEDEVINRANRLGKEYIDRASRRTGIDYSKAPVL